MKINSSFLLLLLSILYAQPLQTQTPVTYEVYALSYGIYPGFPVSALIGGADKNRKIDLQMMILYLYENLEKHAPIAQTFDANSNIKAQDRMRQIASRADLIIPGHDPEVFVKFPKPGNGVARIQ